MNLESRLEKLEQTTGINSMHFRATRDGDCISCVVSSQIDKITEDWEREQELYVEIPSEDIIYLPCRECGRGLKTDVRGYNEEERGLLRQMWNEEIAVEKVNSMIEQRSIKLWGAAELEQRRQVFRRAHIELTGVDPLDSEQRGRYR